MSRTRFRPETDGFAFTNSWTFDSTEISILTNIVSTAVDAIEIVLSPIITAALGPVLIAEAAVPFIGPWLVYETVKKANDAIVNAIVGAIDAKPYGLCGGMAFSSLDYFVKGWVVPRGTGSGDQPQRTTPTGTALRDYIWSRLIKSLEDNAGTFLQWMAVLHFEGGPGGTWLRDQTRAHLALLKVRIDVGMPVTVGLIGTTWNPMNNHQVLVYGYQDNPDGTCTLFVYDNNAPNVESTIQLDFSGSALSAAESCASNDRGPLRGLFCTSYGPQTPPRAVVLRSGLTAIPPQAGRNETITVQLTAANIGYHDSPALKLVAASDAGSVIQEAGFTSLAEGGARSLSSGLAFSTAGSHRIGAVAALGTFGGISITKQLPPEGATQSPTVSVMVFPDRAIRTVTTGQCEITNCAGSTVRFTTGVGDMGSGATYQWTVAGGTISSGASSPEVEVKLPDQANVNVTIDVRVSLPNGAFSTGSYTFATISNEAAGIERTLCQLRHIMFQPPFMVNPIGPDPGPDNIAHINPADIAALRDAASSVVNAAAVAMRINAPMVLGPGIRSILADKLAQVGTIGIAVQQVSVGAVTGGVTTPVATLETQSTK
jgi:hypothetical protein